MQALTRFEDAWSSFEITCFFELMKIDEQRRMINETVDGAIKHERNLIAFERKFFGQSVEQLSSNQVAEGYRGAWRELGSCVRKLWFFRRSDFVPIEINFSDMAKLDEVSAH